MSTNVSGEEVYWLNATRTSADYERDDRHCKGAQKVPVDAKTKECLMHMGWCPVTKRELKSGVRCPNMGIPVQRELNAAEWNQLKAHYQSIEIGMSKEQVEALMLLEPVDKITLDTDKGVMECWSWDTPFGMKSILFVGGTVAQTGISSCLNAI